MTSSKDAVTSLWIIAGLNFVAGAILWLVNQGEQYSAFGRPNESAIFWTAFGTGLVSFAIGVVVITLATIAIVSAIRENRFDTKQPSEAR